MGKLELYIDTSVFGFLFEKELLEKKKVTEEFFRKVNSKKFIINISELVLIEIQRITEKNLRGKMLDVVNKIKPEVLSYNEEIENIAKELVNMEAIPEKYIDDGRHIAYTVFYELDGIVSWNMKHIVKFSTKRIVNALCILKGYKEIEILTPEEVIYER